MVDFKFLLEMTKFFAQTTKENADLFEKAMHSHNTKVQDENLELARGILQEKFKFIMNRVMWKGVHTTASDQINMRFAMQSAVKDVEKLPLTHDDKKALEALAKVFMAIIRHKIAMKLFIQAMLDYNNGIINSQQFMLRAMQAARETFLGMIAAAIKKLQIEIQQLQAIADAYLKIINTLADMRAAIDESLSKTAAKHAEIENFAKTPGLDPEVAAAAKKFLAQAQSVRDDLQQYSDALGKHEQLYQGKYAQITQVIADKKNELKDQIALHDKLSTGAAQSDELLTSLASALLDVRQEIEILTRQYDEEKINLEELEDNAMIDGDMDKCDNIDATQQKLSQLNTELKQLLVEYEATYNQVTEAIKNRDNLSKDELLEVLAKNTAAMAAIRQELAGQRKRFDEVVIKPELEAREVKEPVVATESRRELDTSILQSDTYAARALSTVTGAAVEDRRTLTFSNGSGSGLSAQNDPILVTGASHSVVEPEPNVVTNPTKSKP